MRDVIAEGLAIINMNATPITRFGVNLNQQIDQSSAVQSAFNAGVPLWIPPGAIYLGNVVTLQTGQWIQGSGANGSVFKPLPGMTADMMHISPGRNRYLRVKDIGFAGLSTANAGQNAMVFIASAGSFGDGGLWESVFENIEITGFDGVSLALLGGVVNTLTPIQENTFRFFKVYRASTNSGAALYAHGQVEHISFPDCRFDGNGDGVTPIGGTDIYIGRCFAASQSQIGPYGTGTALSAQAPNVITFTNCSTEQADQAVLIDACQNVVIENQWFEQNNNGVKTQNGAQLTMIAPRFVSSGVGGTGILMNALSASEMSLLGRFDFGGTYTTALQTDASGSIDPSGSGVGTVSMNNVVWDMTIGTGTTQLTTRGAPGVYASFSNAGITLNQWDSSLGPGKTVICKVKTTSPNPVTFSNSGSSVLGFNLGNGIATLAALPGDTVIFRRSMILKGWDLVAKI